MEYKTMTKLCFLFSDKFYQFVERLYTNCFIIILIYINLFTVLDDNLVILSIGQQQAAPTPTPLFLRH